MQIKFRLIFKELPKIVILSKTQLVMYNFSYKKKESIKFINVINKNIGVSESEIKKMCTT